MEADFLIIGSGIAGLTAARKAAKYGKVVLATKDKIEESNTLYAQGGLAAVFGIDDTVKTHVRDTLRAGDGISNRKIATILAEETPKRVLELKKLGIPFDYGKKGFSLSREAVHSRARIVHVSDNTGEVVEKKLAEKIKKKVTILEYHLGFELIVEKNICLGCRFIDLKNDTVIDIFSKKIILATGGIGQLYSKTTNPTIATGDGIAIAFNAGAILEDMEFIQFHPTMLYNSKPSFLISETLRGEGGLLKNREGKSYMHKYHRDGDLAPRDVVSKFSVIEMKRTRSKVVYLDMRHIEGNYLRKRFPHIYKECLKYRIDLTKQMIPVSPAAHYICGGIKTNEFGQTSVKNLYAVGECACNQLHGADRLASNSLTEGLVFGTRMIERIGKVKGKVKKKELLDINLGKVRNGRIIKLKKQLQEIMWHHVGIIRTKKGLRLALRKINRIQTKLDVIKVRGISKEIIELDNLLSLGKIVAVSALRRKESRGTHFIQDYDDRYDNIWKKHLVIDKNHRKLV